MTSYEEALKTCGCLSFMPKGTSMQPLIICGRDTVFVVEKKGRLKKYDVALYKRSDVYVLHRVMKVLDGGYVFCGDNHIQFEEVKEEQVLGVAEGRYVGDKYKKFSGLKYKLYILIWCKSMFVRRVLLHFKNKYFRNTGKEYEG